MEPFVSTTDNPLKFLSDYLQLAGEVYLRKQFEGAKESNFSYSTDKDVIIAQGILPINDVRGELLDNETNTREYEITFKQFISQEFQSQLTISKKLIGQKSRQNPDDQDYKLYKRILINCLDIQRWVDSQTELRYRSNIDGFISGILKYSYKKFNHSHPGMPQVHQVKKYFKNRSEANITGYKLKSQVRNGSLKEFLDQLKENGFIHRRTNHLYLLQFLNGKIPTRKINWIKDPHELVGFINFLCNDSILLKTPGQKWKYLQDIFLIKGEDLPDNWHRNHNKLKDKTKIRQIFRIIDLLKPHQHN